ncbi:MAG: DUF6515 family protein [Bacteroidota bacterium]
MKTSSTLNRSLVVFSLAILIVGSLSAQRGRSRYGYNSWRYYPARGQVFVHLPGPSISLQFGGNPFYYSGGLFYRPYGSYYSIAPAPIGIHVNILPRGYWSLRWGGYPYYYYNGIFYRQSNNAYEVVQAPVGAEVPAIPRDAQPVVIDGEKYYEYNGTYFKDYIKPNGELWYTVEGKHGVLNTDRNPAPAINTQPAAPATAQPAIGDVVDKLPNDCRTVVINGIKYFVTPANVYYEEVVDGKQVRYKVAGK